MWACEYCRGLQKDDKVTCPSCGAHRVSAAPVKESTQKAMYRGEYVTLNELREVLMKDYGSDKMLEQIFWPLSSEIAYLGGK